MKVLFHIDSNDKWNLVSENIKNLINYIKEKDVSCLIEVVANGNAVNGLRKDNDNMLLFKDLIEDHVVFAACNNALNKFEISADMLYSFVQVVPAGIVEIIEKQEKGYSYIKP